jgi:hypothetical protein
LACRGGVKNIIDLSHASIYYKYISNNYRSKAMALTKKDLLQIEEHIKNNIVSWIGDIPLTKSQYFNEIELIERIVRVEEELKSQRELMQAGFEHMNKRFEQVDKRFEDVNSRFTMMFTFMTLGFTILAAMMTIFKFLA